MDTMVEGLYALDGEGRLTFMNSAGSRMRRVSILGCACPPRKDPSWGDHCAKLYLLLLAIDLLQLAENHPNGIALPSAGVSAPILARIPLTRLSSGPFTFPSTLWQLRRPRGSRSDLRTHGLKRQAEDHHGEAQPRAQAPRASAGKAVQKGRPKAGGGGRAGDRGQSRQRSVDARERLWNGFRPCRPHRLGWRRLHRPSVRTAVRSGRARGQGLVARRVGLDAWGPPAHEPLAALGASGIVDVARRSTRSWRACRRTTIVASAVGPCSAVLEAIVEDADAKAACYGEIEAAVASGRAPVERDVQLPDDGARRKDGAIPSARSSCTLCRHS